ncbi:TMV resistance protein N isoform X2 [Lactuca sativa]|uniref:TMV resistance protein N isoform X2 n=1 Tax=Lactuca sativa TaxID=4236 RepID=UPI0022AFF55E|nr:TMV resistance protein N isoform X2 [Lactuca sativa]XP_052622025.1 TMV resistance protein N isoform X2 [Lactuca sativa]
MSMASSSSSPSDVTFSSEVWKYHVFLSFRGEDTRKTFVDHLYTALEEQGIYTYKDDETLPRGESIGPSLEKAIEESQIAVIIFSKNYADSSWCLDELVHIMKCKDARNQIVMPVFYNVDPAEVRKQKRKYREAFAKHALENNKKVESWKKALVDASNISGWEPEHIANGHESKCIKTIVDTISRRLHPITSSVDDNLVGVEARMQRLISQIGFGGKRMIGIWGVGGGGKTTLASSIYDEISSMFDGCCFLKNIREESSNKDGLENLQAEILSGVLKQEKLEVRRVEEGRCMLKDRLQYRKVLIVLDDVDNLDQLEELAGSRDWFGEGSRIIITTRDEHVLTGDKVDVIHNINLLNNDEAMKLFYKHAPRGHRRIEDYERLSKDVVSYSGGLPLALRVLGRFLCDKEMNEWRSALARLKEIPDANILEKLKISFDGLTPLERELFLDIACFFRRRLKDEESLMILDVCGYHPVIGIKVLVQKALIVISEDGRFDMHDLVQEMAHYIVRRKHPKNPEKHSRVWKKEDILKICAMDVMTNLDKIEAIYGRWCRSDESQRVLQVATNMKKLRWIYLANRMTRVMDERKVNGGTLPLIIVPEHFPPRELCCLTFNWLNAKQLWEGNKSFTLCQLEAWLAEYKVRRGATRTVEVEEIDDNDDSCGLCGDGGELICCDNCPSTSHLTCLCVQELPEGNALVGFVGMWSMSQ